MHLCISVIEHKLVYFFNYTEWNRCAGIRGTDKWKGWSVSERKYRGSYTVIHIILSILYPCKIIHVCLFLHLGEPGNMFGGR